ncbi:MAG: hypothetical protein SGPRY_012585 [Prymnesium sp.]
MGKPNDRSDTSRAPKLPHDLLSFLRRADKLLQDLSPSPSPSSSSPAELDALSQQRREVADSVLSQVVGFEIATSRHVFGSCVLQHSLKHASPPLRAQAALSLFRGGGVVGLLTDKYGSHVAEAALSHTHHNQTEGVEEGEGGEEPLLPAVVEVLLEGGGRVLSAAMRDSCQLLRWPEGEGDPVGEESVEHVRSLARDRCGSHLIEAMLRLPKAGWWRQLHRHCFKGQLAALAAHESGNYVALLSTATDARSHAAVLKELLPALPSLLSTRAGVVCRLAQAIASPHSTQNPSR